MGCGGNTVRIIHSPVENNPLPEIRPGTCAAVDTVLNPLTGKWSKNHSSLAVMINNAPPAQPQTGLAAADLVYEIEMEGVMTRFVAFIIGDPPENAGPVRRRPYVLMLARMGCIFCHVGL